MTKVKSRNFAFLIYPDSAPDNFVERLEDNISNPMAISPIHDSDVKELDSKAIEELSPDDKKLYEQKKLFKKPHYHALFHSDNPISTDAVRNKIQRALGDKTINTVKVVDNMQGAFSYLTHESKDAIRKHKHLYKKADLTLLNDFDVDRYITMSAAEKSDKFTALTKAVRHNDLANIIELTDWLEEHGGEIDIKSPGELNKVIDGKVGMLRLYFDGVYQKRRSDYEKQQFER